MQKDDSTTFLVTFCLIVEVDLVDFHEARFVNAYQFTTSIRLPLHLVEALSLSSIWLPLHLVEALSLS